MSGGRTYYVYALKDPRIAPSMPFYVGKGSGVRAWEHELNVDESRKGQRIAAIHAAGQQVLVTKLVDELTELDALRIEAELISAFGVESRGGLLTNAIRRSLITHQTKKLTVVVPSGAYEKAQAA